MNRVRKSVKNRTKNKMNQNKILSWTHCFKRNSALRYIIHVRGEKQMFMSSWVLCFGGNIQVFEKKNNISKLLNVISWSLCVSCVTAKGRVDSSPSAISRAKNEILPRSEQSVKQSSGLSTSLHRAMRQMYAIQCSCLRFNCCPTWRICL